MGKDREKPSYLNIPNVWEVRKEDWIKHAFNGKSALRVLFAGEETGYDFYINMDNIYLQVEMKTNSKIEPKLLEARFKYGMVLLGLSLLNFYDQEDKKRSLEEDRDTSTYERIAIFSRAIAPTLLPMISSLGDLEIEP